MTTSLNNIKEKIWTAFEFVCDILLPEKCFGCGKYGNVVCKKCKILSIRPIIVTEDSFAATTYENPTIKKLIWKLKYSNAKHSAKAAAEIMKDSLWDILATRNLLAGQTTGQIAVVPVPMSPIKRKERGYNQAEEIAKRLVSLDSSLSPVLDVLVKIKETKSQVKTKGRAERQKNLRGTFAVNNSEKISDKIVLLVDDVITTGATTTECKKILESAGAHKVIVIALAYQPLG
jgi:ComF family protein